MRRHPERAHERAAQTVVARQAAAFAVGCRGAAAGRVRPGHGVLSARAGDRRGDERGAGDDDGRREQEPDSFPHSYMVEILQAKFRTFSCRGT